jgi:hypothetical protein
MLFQGPQMMSVPSRAGEALLVTKSQRRGERKLLFGIWKNMLETEIQRAEGRRAKYKMKEARSCPGRQARQGPRGPGSRPLRGLSVTFNDPSLIIGSHLQASERNLVSLRTIFLVTSSCATMTFRRKLPSRRRNYYGPDHDIISIPQVTGVLLTLSVPAGVGSGSCDSLTELLQGSRPYQDP